ncbi:MAG: PfkB family carbohydrate kinase [Planctomycetales bacterium]
MLDTSTLDRILNSLSQASIAVVGDLFLDKYLELDARLTEKSVETGLDAYQVTNVRCYPGAGGTVLNNLHALGVGQLHTLSVIGNDGEGFELMCELDKLGVQTEHVIQSAERMTPTYTKPMLNSPDGSSRELNRLDIKNRSKQSDALDQAVIAHLEELLPNVQAIILADQVSERNFGVITDAVREHLSVMAAKHPDKIFYADSRSHIGLFKNCLVKPNQSEICHAVGISDGGESMPEGAVLEAANKLAAMTGRPLFTTRGPNGIVYLDGGKVERIPGLKVTGPIDICGAGDSTSAGIVSALCAGATPAQAAHLGCLVASITIQQIGVTGTASPAQVRQRLADQQQGRY